MFYVIVALWAIGCVACWLLKRVQKKVLTVTCIKRTVDWCIGFLGSDDLKFKRYCNCCAAG